VQIEVKISYKAKNLEIGDAGRGANAESESLSSTILRVHLPKGHSLKMSVIIAVICDNDTHESSDTNVSNTSRVSDPEIRIRIRISTIKPGNFVMF